MCLNIYAVSAVILKLTTLQKYLQQKQIGDNNKNAFRNCGLKLHSEIADFTKILQVM